MYVTEAKQNSGIMDFLLNPSARPPSGPIVIGVVEGIVAPDVPVSSFPSPILDRKERGGVGVGVGERFLASWF